MAHLKNTTNEYAGLVEDIFDKTPKAVFAAIAVSYATCGGDVPEKALPNIVHEWQLLFDNGIVTQDPRKYLGVDLFDEQERLARDGAESAKIIVS